MKKLLLYLFLITAGLISTVQVSAQKAVSYTHLTLPTT